MAALHTTRCLLLEIVTIAGAVCCSAWSADAQEQKSFTGGVKDGVNKVTSAFTPSKKEPSEAETANDALSLKRPAKASNAVYVAVAQMYEQSGKLVDAEKQYQAAIQHNPHDLATMVGYARLKERMNKPNDALKMYQQAAKEFAGEASVFNNLGLCLARQGKLDDAVQAMGRAVLLQPKNPLYRNNIAAILVDQGKMEDAFSHLRSVHGGAAAYYNMGYLLQMKGRKPEALRHFALALQQDSSLTQAQVWIERLQGTGVGPAAPSAAGAVAGTPEPRMPVTVGSRRPVTMPPPSAVAPTPPSPAPPRGWTPSPSSSDELPPMPPETVAPRRLPPTNDSRSMSLTIPPLSEPATTSGSGSAQVAPLPPAGPSGMSAPLPPQEGPAFMY